MRRLVALLVAVASWLCLASSTAGAQAPSVSDLGLEVVIGFEGHAGMASWTPVEVYLEPIRPVVGRLEVRASDGATFVRDIEVSAASRSVYRFLTTAGGALEVTVVPRAGEPLSVRTRRPQASGQYLGGVLGQVPVQAPALGSEFTGQTGTWVGVDPAWLELSARSLDTLGGLVADLSALEALNDGARRNLVAAVAGGLDLTVAVDRDGPVDLREVGFPVTPAVSAASGTVRALEPAGEAWALRLRDVEGTGATGTGDEVVAVAAGVGRGRVAMVGAELGAEGLGRSPLLWGQLVQPASAARRHEGDWSPTDPWRFASILQQPGSSVPALPWLAAFLIAYVIVVGPVNGVVLSRMRRRELAWVTVPLVTAVFTTGAFAGAVGRQPPTGVSGRVGYWVDGAAAEIVVVGMRAPTEGLHTAVLPGGDWTVETVIDGQRESRIVAGPDTVAELDLSALQLGGVVAYRTTTVAPPLDVEAVATAGTVSAAVTNTSSRPVRDVRLRLGTLQRTLGTLAPGASKSVDLRPGPLRRVEPYGDPLATAVGPGGVTALPASLQALLQATLIDGNPGVLWAVGSTGSAATGVQVDTRTPDDGGSLVAVGSRVMVRADAPTPPQAVARAALASGDGYMPGPLAIEGPGSAVLRYRFPPRTGDEALFGSFPEDGPPIELAVWDHTERLWRPADEALPGDGGDPRRWRSPLGEVFVRVTGELFPLNFSAFSVSGVESGR